MLDRIRSSWAAVIMAAAVLIFAACATAPAPRNVSDSIAYGYAAIASARNTAASLLDRKAITVDDARRVQLLADQARTALDAALDASKAGDMRTADDQLRLVNTILLQLENFIKTKEPPK